MKLFQPLHDYTKSLLSAIPTADPESEKVRQRLHFDGLAYGEDQWADCSLVEVAPDHFIYCHPSEVAGYKAQVKPALALV